MLLGEHAVLHGHRAIVAAVDMRVTVTVKPRTDGNVQFDSALGKRTMSCEAIDNSSPFQFLATAVTRFAKQSKSGFSVSVESDMPTDAGLGTSAAVIAASTAALQGLFGEVLDKHALQDACLGIIRRVQGSGSGADVAASIFGGAVLYRMQPREITSLNKLPPLTVCYSGSKVPTPEVIRIVEKHRAADPKRFERLYSAADLISGQAAEAIRVEDWKTLGEAIDSGQHIMKSIGVSTERLDAMVATLREDSGIYGSKISGSGLGDCVVGIGRAQKNECQFARIAVALSSRGIELE